MRTKCNGWALFLRVNVIEKQNNEWKYSIFHVRYEKVRLTDAYLLTYSMVQSPS